MYCRKCKKEFSGNERFCSVCGQPLEMRSIAASHTGKYKGSKRLAICLAIGCFLIVLITIICFRYFSKKESPEDKIIGTWYVLDKETGTLNHYEYLTFFENKTVSYNDGEGSYLIDENGVITITLESIEWTAVFETYTDDAVPEEAQREWDLEILHLRSSGSSLILAREK